LTVPFCIACLLSPDVCEDAESPPLLPRAKAAIGATSQILGKIPKRDEVRNDHVAATAPAGWPKSDCTISKPDKYGASMAVIRQSQRRF